jgi:hydrogenase expression/formation protein HypC
MCLGIPARVVELVDAELQLAKVDVSGVRRVINVALLDGEVAVGDWVLLHVGFAMSRIDEDEALETLRLLEQLGAPFELELDELRASRIR